MIDIIMKTIIRYHDISQTVHREVPPPEDGQA